MMKLPAVLGFTALTFISWGTYGVLLHHGQENMHAMLKPFVFVGVAYFFIAVLFPGLMLTKKNEKGDWSFIGTVLSFFAGAVGALGALGIIMALNFGGKPVYVMPFVFGLAPVVNTLVTATINKTFNQIKFPFMIGLALVILGAIGVLASKGLTNKKIEREKANAVGAVAVEQPATASTDAIAESSQPKPTDIVRNAEVATDTRSSQSETSTLGIIFSMVMAAFCWGAYGPVLHIGQMRMGGSRLRPFICVGLAYFFIAVALPLTLIQMGFDKGTWDATGAIWSTAAGALGAMGALGIIYAFNFGGKPIFCNAIGIWFCSNHQHCVSMSESGTLSQISPLFVFSLATTIAGAVMVLVFQPASKHGKPQSAPAKDPTTKPTKSTESSSGAVVAQTAGSPVSSVVATPQVSTEIASSTGSIDVNPKGSAQPPNPS